LLVSCKQITDPAHNSDSLVCIATDVTPYKQAAKDAECLNELLRNINQDLTITALTAIEKVAHERFSPIELLSCATLSPTDNAKCASIQSRVADGIISFDLSQQSEYGLAHLSSEYNSLFENLPVAFAYCKVLTDEEGGPIDFVFLNVNAAYERLMGRNRKDVLGRLASRVIPPLALRAFHWIEVCGRVARSGEPVEFERYLFGLDSWYSFSVYSPSPDYFVLMFTDVTDRKRMEEALHQSEEYHRSLFENAKDMLFTLTPTNKIISLNRAFSEISGWQPEELIGKSFSVIMDYEELTGARDAWQRVLDGESISAYELRILTKSGDYICGELTAAPLFNEGEVTAVLCIMRDITMRKRGAVILGRYMLMRQYARDIILFMNEDGSILEANDAATEAYGYERDELLKMKIFDLLPRDFVPASPPRTAAASAGPEGLQFEGKHRKKDGTIFDVEISTRAATIEGKQVTLSIIRDTSERKRAEESLRKTQSLLQHSEKMASIGQLAAGVAHEINNPIGFITSNLNTLGEYVGSLKECLSEWKLIQKKIEADPDIEILPLIENFEETRRSLDIDFLIGDIESLTRECLEGSRRMAKIVQDLKTFARADDGEVQLADLEGILDSALNIVWNQLKYNCVVTKDYSMTPRIPCNPVQLGQVFVNILVNASQAIGSDKRGQIRISSYAEGDYAYVEIVDTGKGIAPENLEKIFDPFFTTKPAGQGTGLGLSISYNIVKKHGGTITAESALGVGTTFKISLPMGR
jgi:PAS domain S-box-containing protein